MGRAHRGRARALVHGGAPRVRDGGRGRGAEPWRRCADRDGPDRGPGWLRAGPPTRSGRGARALAHVRLRRPRHARLMREELEKLRADVDAATSAVIAAEVELAEFRAIEEAAVRKRVAAEATRNGAVSQLATAR